MFGIDKSDFSGKIALIEDNQEFTYKQLKDIAMAISSQVENRSLVFVLTSNSVPSIAAYVGLVNERKVPLLLDSRLSQELIDMLVVQYQPPYIWAPGEKETAFAGYRKIYEQRGYVLLYAKEATPYSMHEDLCLLISTSGSTGSPKLVRQTYKNIQSNTAAIIDYLEITSQERAVTSLPMSYVYGLSVLNTHLQSGASVVLTGQNCYAKAFWDLVNMHGVTSFAGVPFMYEMLDKLRMFTKDIRSVRTFTQAGGKLNADLQEKLTNYAAEHGKKFVVMYGASEATARMAYLPMERALEKKGSIGLPIPGGRFELLDDNGTLIEEPEQMGELVYYGDNVTPGYATKGEELILDDENHGRLITGDIAKRDADGFYYIVGRRKRFIKMFGNRFNLDDVDAVLKKKFDTLDIVSSGEDDFLDIYVVDETLIPEIYNYIFQVFGINRKKMAVYPVEEIPKNASGKILFSKLNELKEQ